MIFFKYRKNKNGFSLIEVLVALVITMITVTLLTGTMSQILKIYSREKYSAIADRQIENLKNKIRLGIDSNNNSYGDNADGFYDIDITAYPLYWSEDVAPINESDCHVKFSVSQCPLIGRLNYIVNQVSDSGLFQVDIAIYHPELNNGQIRKESLYITVRR